MVVMGALVNRSHSHGSSSAGGSSRPVADSPHMQRLFPATLLLPRRYDAPRAQASSTRLSRAVRPARFLQIQALNCSAIGRAAREKPVMQLAIEECESLPLPLSDAFQFAVRLDQNI